MSPHAEPVSVRIEGVAKTFGAVHALQDAWLEIQPGEFLTLLGPSGCGKTTLLNIIAGFLQPDQGEVFIGKELATYLPTHKREIGMVFQNYALFPHMTVAANVDFGLRMQGAAKGVRAERVAETLTAVGLAGYEGRYPRELSGGQQQRVALARAMAMGPKVLLLDEPLSALDKNLREQMQIELKEIQRKFGVTTVFVTHDQGEALALSDRIAVMSGGRIEQLGTPRDIYLEPENAFAAAFIGDANRLGVKVAPMKGDFVSLGFASGATLEVDASRVRGIDPSVGGEGWLFVRPEHLRLVPASDDCWRTGRIGRMTFQGASVIADVDVAGIGTLRLVLDARRIDGVDTAASVGIGLDATRISVFPNAERAG